MSCSMIYTTGLTFQINQITQEFTETANGVVKLDGLAVYTMEVSSAVQTKKWIVPVFASYSTISVSIQ